MLAGATVVRSMSGATVVQSMSGATVVRCNCYTFHVRYTGSSTVTRQWFVRGVFHVVTLNSRTPCTQYHVSACHVNLAVRITDVTSVLQIAHHRGPIRQTMYCTYELTLWRGRVMFVPPRLS